MEWEQIDNWHQRAKVYGGWLVKAYEDVSHFNADEYVEKGHDFRVAMTFVPDPYYLWKIENV